MSGNESIEQDARPLAKKIRPLLWALGIIGLLILLLYKLATLPYRPPHDMSTFLGGPELLLVWTLITMLGLAWIVLFVRALFMCARTRKCK